MLWKQPKKFVVQKGNGAVDHNTVTRWFKKFHPVGLKLNFNTVLQTIEANLVSDTRRVSGNMENIKSITNATASHHIKRKVLEVL